MPCGAALAGSSTSREGTGNDNVSTDWVGGQAGPPGTRAGQRIRVIARGARNPYHTQRGYFSRSRFAADWRAA